MEILIRKIFHRNQYHIGLFFKHDYAVQTNIKLMGAVYSKTLRCWYVDYSEEKYKELKTIFPNLIIEQPVTGVKESRDHSPIAKSKIQLGLNSRSNKPEHIVNLDSLAKSCV